MIRRIGIDPSKNRHQLTFDVCGHFRTLEDTAKLPYPLIYVEQAILTG